MATEFSVAVGAAPTRADVELRVHRFSVVRAAERALAPSTSAPMRSQDIDAVHMIRERLRVLANRFSDGGSGDLPAPLSEEIEAELEYLDGALSGYAEVLRARLETHSIAQLRASLSVETGALRSEVEALLELCMECERSPSRLLHVVDFLLTLLCTSERDGVWIFQTDPANLNDAMRLHCSQAPLCGSGLESTIVSRFQRAAEALAHAENGETIVREISAYKKEIANFYYVPAILRCIIGYNAAARNHFAERVRQRRALDSAIDEEMLLFGGDSTAAEEDSEQESLLEAHEYPGILSVQEAIGRRIRGAESMDDPASRIAADFDIEWLEEPERVSFLESDGEGVHRLVRMSIVLGHLAISMPDHQPEFAALSLHATQLDAWICRLGEEVQERMNELIVEHFGGAQALADVRSRFLTAVLLVARRRRGAGRSSGGSDSEAEEFERDAIDLVREYLNRQEIHRAQPMFLDFLGGGWRRSIGIAAVCLLVAWGVASSFSSGGPREIHEFSKREARRVSPHLASAYRDHADTGSMFFAVAAPSWMMMEPDKKQRVAENIAYKLKERGVEELMIFDQDRMLQAHYQRGVWRTDRAWTQ